MGKMGALLRAQKAQKATYTFTAEQLRARDEALKASWKKDVMARVLDDARELDRQRMEEFTKRSNELWAERERRFKTGYQQGDVLAMASALMSITVAVLVEDFHWTPVRNGHRTKLQRFCEGVIERMNVIGQDENLDIMRYSDEIDKKYGVSFLMEDAEDGN